MTSPEMLYSEIIAVCSEIHKQRINKSSLRGLKVKFWNVKPGATYSNNQALHSGKRFIQF